MRFAICQELFEGWDWARQCAFVSEVGYTGIEVAPFAIADDISTLTGDARALMRRQAADHGLAIIGLHWLLAKTEGLHLTSADQSVRAATADYLVALGRLCADLGGDVMVFGSPQQRDVPSGLTEEQALDNAAEVFRSAMPQIADWGVRLCMEPLTSKETDFINTCSQAVELIDRVDHSAMCLHQDVKAMLGAESDGISQLIETYRDRVGHFHVNDTNLLGPGMGDTDFGPIFAALLATGYSGWVSVEVFDYSPGCEQIARQSYQYMQDTLQRVSG
ncbi:MAG: sugar phosphate isomerase/epimerase family protein [Planctomycetaceae bacterium]